MGYLTKIFDKYYETQDYNIVKEFRNRLWNTLPYIKLERSYTYFITDDVNETDKTLLEKYKCQKYKILKSRYSKEEMFPEDYIKAKINSNYARYFDKDVYLDKKYYYYLANYKNIYFKYINGDVKDLKKEINDNNKKVKEYKKLSIERKNKLSWKEYKGVVDRAIDNVFKNYVPLDIKIENEEFTPNGVLDWDDDNYIIGYVNKSINGEVIKFIDEGKGNRCRKSKIKHCEVCGKLIKYKSKKTPKYCSKCAKEIQQEQKNKWKREKWHKEEI